MYFSTHLSRQPDSIFIQRISEDQAGKSPKQTVIAYLYYKVKAGDKLVIETALSGTSVEGALANLSD